MPKHEPIKDPYYRGEELYNRVLRIKEACEKALDAMSDGTDAEMKAANRSLGHTLVFDGEWVKEEAKHPERDGEVYEIRDRCYDYDEALPADLQAEDERDAYEDEQERRRDSALGR